MADLSKLKIEQSIRDRKELHARFLDNSDTYRSFLEAEKSAFSPGDLSKKAKELMALSISIVTKCEPCIEWHAEQALLSGATEKEFFETVDVAIEMGGGPAGAYARFALNTWDHFRKRHDR